MWSDRSTWDSRKIERAERACIYVCSLIFNWHSVFRELNLLLKTGNKPSISSVTHLNICSVALIYESLIDCTTFDPASLGIPTVLKDVQYSVHTHIYIFTFNFNMLLLVAVSIAISPKFAPKLLDFGVGFVKWILFKTQMQIVNAHCELCECVAFN